MSSVSKDTHGSYYEKMSIIRTNIYNKPYDNWTIQGMSHQLTMSESYFQHLYKKIFGTGVMNDVIQSRIEHAKYLLSTTDISIEHISQMCGYNSSSHFMRQFKKKQE
ncbi:MAG: helix-turn-helix transcriptional regulator [Coprococcus sp.]